MASGIIEKLSNDSDNGYCKMPDGTLIQWGIYAVNGVAIDRPWGQIFESAIQDMDFSFPIPFIALPAVTASARTSPTSWLETLGASTSKLNTFYLNRPTVAASVSGVISWLAIGRWK